MEKWQVRILVDLEEKMDAAEYELDKAKLKVKILETQVAEGRIGNALDRKAYKAMSQLDDAYNAMSVARGEYNRCKRVFKHNLYKFWMDE